MPKKTKTFSHKRESYENHTSFIVTDIDFTIKVNHPELGFWKIRDRLNRGVIGNERNSNDRENDRAFEYFIREHLSRHANRADIILVVNEYSEREGSFIAAFSFVVFAFMNYGQFRESLDYLREDFNTILRDFFPDDATIMVDYRERPNHFFEEFNDRLINEPNRIFRREFSIVKRWIYIIGVLSIGLASYAIYEIENKPTTPTIDSTTMEALIRMQIDKINAERTNEELLRLLKEPKENKTDTAKDKRQHKVKE